MSGQPARKRSVRKLNLAEADLEYASLAYGLFATQMKKSATTRAVVLDDSRVPYP